MTGNDRGSGRTTRQIVDAPRDAVFVCAGSPRYTERLARHLRRDDLKILPFNFDSVYRAVIGTHRQIVIDHALPLGTNRRDWEEHGRVKQLQLIQAAAQQPAAAVAS